MSEQLNTNINGLDSTFLKKAVNQPFDDCITHHSLRFSNPELQKTLAIYKYIPLRYLLVLLKEKMLILKPVASWEDPYENFFLKQRFVQPGHSDPWTSVENLAKGLYGMSWSLQEETDSLWRIYSPDKMSVRITTTVEKMVEMVCSEDDKWDVWMNKVKYLNDDEIKEWLAQCKYVKDIDQFIEKLSESFFIKRNAFSAEQEFRIVVNYTKKRHPSICFRCEPEKLITSYLVDPRLNEYEYQAIKASLMDFGVDENNISKSKLYDFQPQKVEMPYDLFQDF